MSRRGLAIATACAGGFLAFLDTTIVNTAFPGIAASFPDASAADLAWVLDAYFIVIAALLVPAGGIADRIGRKRVFLAGLALFTGASALCAAAPGLEVLIAARALQGAGAAVIMAVSLALILPLYPVAQRASAVAVWGASAALAAASGPPLGGALVELDWRWVFVVNLPLGAAIFLAGRAAFVEQRDERMAGLPDLLGATLVMGGLGLLSLAILEGGTWGWTSLRVLAAFAASAFLLAATAHRCLTHPRPVIDPALLRIGTFARANVGLLLLGMAFFSTILANVLFLVGVWGYSVLTAGLAVVPGAIATAAVAVPAGKIADRYGQSAVIVPGCLLYVAGMAIVRGAGIEPAFLTTWLPAMLLNGAGLGLAFPAFAAAALRDVPAEHFGSASAVTSATRQLGGVLGTAVLFAVGAPFTLAAAEDAYLVSTLWALGAGVVAATLHGRVFTLGLGAVVVTGVLVFAGPAAAAPTDVVVNFDSGPALDTPITNQYAASAFVSFNQADAPRPYRKAAPGAARSGTTVANIGADLCELETPDDDCEFPIGWTAGRLTRTASGIRFYAGLFQPSQQPVTLQIIGYRANGTVAATGAETMVASATFTTPVSVTSAAADIARFAVVTDGNGAIGAKMGFDDLTLTYPENALPDMALSVPPGEIALVPGASQDIPITVTRLNGSAGPVTFSATGLPAGVTASFNGTTLRLTAAVNAPRTDRDVPRPITITATPGNGDVAPAPRSVELPARVMRPFRLSGPSTVAVPACGSLDVALKLERDRAYKGTIKLAAKNLPTGVTATFDPGPDIPVGGPLDVDVRLKLTAAGDVAAVPITVEADAQPIQIGLTMGHTARITYPGTRLIAPRRLGQGSLVTLDGDFCPGTRVRVGTAETDATLDGRTLRFNTPRLATSGPLTILPPGGTPYVVADVEVDTFRSAGALPFENFPYGGFSYEEALETFGADDLLTQINACWPFGTCTVTLPIPDPTAALVVPIIDQLMQNTGGHCFGIARAEQGWAVKPASLRRFTAGTVFSATKTASMSGYLDGQHATQASAEFLNAWLKRKRGVDNQLRVVRETLTKGGLPMISVAEGQSGHAVLAYDIVDHPDGRADILVADSNVPFLASELTNATLHADRETRLSVVRISASRNAWELDVGSKTWRGGDNTIFAFPRGAIPDNPTLPGLSIGRTMILFGAKNGSVISTATADDDYLPVLDAAAAPGTAGFVAGASHTVKGVKAGTYRQAVIGEKTVAAVTATASAGSEDTLRMRGSSLVYEHKGKPTTMELTLGAVKSGPVKVADGQTVTAKPSGDSVKLTVGKRTRTLKSRAKLTITRDGKIKLSGLKGKAHGAVVMRVGKTRKVFEIKGARNRTLAFGPITRKAKKVAKFTVSATVVADGQTLRRTKEFR